MAELRIEGAKASHDSHEEEESFVHMLKRLKVQTPECPEYRGKSGLRVSVRL